MIFSENRKPTVEEFSSLMRATDRLLNQDAEAREDYYVKRGGKLLEKDVYDALCERSVGTPFQGSIQLVSGASFPDIVAHKFYGVEVKSTEKNHWTSIGSSILESTRDQDVERIFLTFGKLGRPVQFLSRPYQECLSGISVTHYPRYQIDMRLQAGETIFDKMGLDYDELRHLENPVAPVAKYYKSQLKEGESLWWSADEEVAVPATIKLWTSLSHEQKGEMAVQGYVFFPEILGVSPKKYNRYALWLAVEQGIVNTNIRDSFSAGGQVSMKTSAGVEVKMPAAFGRIGKYRDYIIDLLEVTDAAALKERWEVSTIAENRIEQWCRLVAESADRTVGYEVAMSVLKAVFCL